MSRTRFLPILLLLSLVFTPLEFAQTPNPSNARVVMPVLAANTSPIFFVTIQGATQGVFKGDSAYTAHRNQIEGVRFSFQVSSPHDPSTGQVTGRRQYTPVAFTKLWDVASPQILTAAATNEALISVVFEFVKVGSDGKEYVYQTVKLSQASISAVRQYLSVPGSGDPSDPRPLEDVSFVFRKIEVTNTTSDGVSTSFADDLLAK